MGGQGKDVKRTKNRFGDNLPGEDDAVGDAELRGQPFERKPLTPVARNDETEGVREFEHGENTEQTSDILFQTQWGDCADHHFAWPAGEARHAIGNGSRETRGIDTVWDIDDARNGRPPNAACPIFELARRDGA